jgi:hypothetical protein
MTDGLKSQEEQQLHAQADQLRGKLEGLTADLRVVDEELESLAPQRKHHELLDQACSSLEELSELGVASLFWGDGIDPRGVSEQLRGVRSRVDAFKAELGKLDERRQAIRNRIGNEEQGLEVLSEELYYLREEEERRKLEWQVERDVSPVPRRIQAMAWARGGEDDKRFRKSLAAMLLASLVLGLLFPRIALPLTDRFEKDDALPRRLAQFIRQEQTIAIPPPSVVGGDQPEQETQEQEEPEPDVPEESPEAAETETAAGGVPEPSEPAGLAGPIAPEEPLGAPPGPPTRRAASAGILAFQEQIASLAQDPVAPRLGANARFGDADEASVESSASRSLLTSNTPGTSGGIDVSALSRNVRGGAGGGGGGGGGGTGGGGGGMPGVDIGRATSSIAGIGGGGSRPRASGSGPALSRTDEEIQIVFDRHKAEFYRFYNRELRNNPTLQGQMVLRLTIEPDGSVSMCVLQSTDMDAPNLADQVVNRVRTIDFGAKEGVQALTIVYPIDFLPASEG